MVSKPNSISSLSGWPDPSTELKFFQSSELGGRATLVIAAASTLQNIVLGCIQLQTRHFCALYDPLDMNLKLLSSMGRK